MFALIVAYCRVHVGGKVKQNTTIHFYHLFAICMELKLIVSIESLDIEQCYKTKNVQA